MIIAHLSQRFWCFLPQLVTQAMILSHTVRSVRGPASNQALANMGNSEVKLRAWC